MYEVFLINYYELVFQINWCCEFYRQDRLGLVVVNHDRQSQRAAGPGGIDLDLLTDDVAETLLNTVC